MQVLSKTAGWAVFLLLAVYYIANRFQGLAFIDSGELALCSLTLGIPHPTGYPLYVILSAPVAQLLARPVIAVTLLSGIITALAGYVFFHIVITLKRRFFPDTDTSDISAAMATLVLFLSPVVAAQGVTNEVYGLALLVNLAAVLAAIRAYVYDQPEAKSRCLIMAWYLAGLALCNHVSSIQLLPGLILITIITLRRTPSPKILAVIPFAFLVPLSLYAILPFRAATVPPPIANWGDVTSWDNFLRHVSGWQFQVWAFSGNIAEVWGNFKTFTGIITKQFPLIILPFIALGIYHLWHGARVLLSFIFIIMAVNIGLGINYSIPDIDSYYLMTIASLMFLAIIGLFYLNSLIRVRYLLPVVTVFLLSWQVLAVWDKNYKGDYTLPEDYALNIGRSAEYGAVVMSEIWDHHGQAFYLQQAEGFRPDLKFIDKELLRRSWYYKTIRNAYPDLYEKIADLIPPFLDEIRVFESGGKFDAPKLERYYQTIVNRLLTECGPAYIDYRLTYSPMGDHYIRPQGLLYKVDTIPTNTPLEQPELLWRGRGLDKYTDWRAIQHLEMISSMTSYR